MQNVLLAWLERKFHRVVPVAGRLAQVNPIVPKALTALRPRRVFQILQLNVYNCSVSCEPVICNVHWVAAPCLRAF